MALLQLVTAVLLLPPHLARPQNFPLHMLVTCNEEWSPWSGCKVYGASLAALAYVAEQHGYRTVHVMASGLDVFFVREDLLAALCWSPPPLLARAWQAAPRKPRHAWPLHDERDVAPSQLPALQPGGHERIHTSHGRPPGRAGVHIRGPLQQTHTTSLSWWRVHRVDR